MPAINVFGSRLAFNARGSGETVVALHATASDSHQWNSLSEHLEGHHCVFAPDLPGQGDSDPWAGRQHPSIADEAEMVFDLIDRWEEPVHLVGHSYGGALALKIAMRHPQWVRSLTLIEPAMFHVLAKGTAADEALFAECKAITGVVNAAMAVNDPVAAMAHFVDFWNGNGTWLRTHRELRHKLTQLYPAAVSNLASSLNETWPLGSVSYVNCPTLLIKGTNSLGPAQRITEMLCEAMPRSQMQTIADAGHMLPLTHPHIVDPLIASHIANAGQNRGNAGFAIAA